MSQLHNNSLSSLPQHLIHSHILTRLDALSLFSTAATSSDLYRLCTLNNYLWYSITTATWPSLCHPLAASLISPSINHHPPIPIHSPSHPSELISAVDLYYEGKPFFSKCHVTQTRKGWFLSSSLWIDILEPNEVVPTHLKLSRNDDVQWLKNLEENLTLSWIMIDPTRNRAVNLSSGSVVSTRWQTLTEELEVVYAVMMEDEVQHVTGKDSMVILQRAMEFGKRKRLDRKEKKESYEKFCRIRKEREDRLLKKYKNIDFVADSMFLAFVVSAFLFWFLRY
ncbi:putative F-box domain-containing protein [Lupinus albus]|uniref:Putative F-box domain-containing protein n=1 Tax=Lupinus albus TaxID=3870 RepID=A0A6A4MXS0_LUPAL|nr:putative F-box domain-containing protein [Lupinus albus]